MITKIVNLNKESFDIYIGRPSKFCNPFIIGKDGNRKEVIDKFKDYFFQELVNDPDLLSLKGKRLGCYCKPKSCHGDIIVDYLNNVNEFFL